MIWIYKKKSFVELYIMEQFYINLLFNCSVGFTMEI